MTQVKFHNLFTEISIPTDQVKSLMKMYQFHFGNLGGFKLFLQYVATRTVDVVFEGPDFSGKDTIQDEVLKLRPHWNSFSSTKAETPEEKDVKRRLVDSGTIPYDRFSCAHSLLMANVLKSRKLGTVNLINRGQAGLLVYNQYDLGAQQRAVPMYNVCYFIDAPFEELTRRSQLRAPTGDFQDNDVMFRKQVYELYPKMVDRLARKTAVTIRTQNLNPEDIEYAARRVIRKTEYLIADYDLIIKSATLVGNT